MNVRRLYGLNIKRLGLMASVAALAACTAVHTPQPVLPSRDTIAAGETASVQGNQNIYAFAHAHNASMREIIVLNNLHPPFALKPGQQLVLPAGATSPVVGDNNKGQAPIPASSPSGAIETMELAPASSAIEAAPVSSQPLSQQPADQNHSNAGVLAVPLAAAPVASSAAASSTGSSSAIGISPVEALNAPSPVNKPLATTVRPLAVTQATGNPEPITPPAQVPPPPPVLPEPIKSAAITAAPSAAASAVTVPAASSFTISWPLQGPILSSFGDKGVGLTNDGINIGAPKGAPVVASAGGTVVYVGNEMKGFGNLILIRHEKGWVTAYAHLDRTLVAKDSVVAQGDMIGTVGKTGNVPSPQLHFETRHDGKPVDPKSLIKN